jgi:hypothetical protein
MHHKAPAFDEIAKIAIVFAADKMYVDATLSKAACQGQATHHMPRRDFRTCIRAYNYSLVFPDHICARR